MLRRKRTATPPSEVAGIPVNYDESKAGSYALAEILRLSSGEPVRDAQTWTEKRRPEILRLFEENQYGRAPGPPKDMSFDVFDKGTPAMDGKAVRKQVTIWFTADKGVKEDLVIYFPAGTANPVPLLLAIDFSPNSSIFDDPGIRLGETWNRDHHKVPPAWNRHRTDEN